MECMIKNIFLISQPIHIFFYKQGNEMQENIDEIKCIFKKKAVFHSPANIKKLYLTAGVKLDILCFLH